MGKRKRRSAKRVRHVVYGRKTKRRSRRYHGGELLGRKHRRSRRYHGRAGLNPMAIVTEVAGIGAGAIAGSFVANMAAKIPFLANPKIKAVVPLLLGIVVSQLKIGQKKLIRDIATGSIAVGTISLIRNMLPSLPLLAGESAESIVNSLKQLSAEEQALLGLDGASTGEVLTGDENEIPAEAVIDQ